MTKNFMKPNELIEYVNSDEYKNEPDNISYSGNLSIQMSELHILTDFYWNNCFSMASSAKGLPKIIDGTLTISGVELWSCEGFPKEVGGIVMTTTCRVLKWKGLENTVIKCTEPKNVLNLPEEGDLKYHPHIFKTDFALRVWLPKNKTKYIENGLFKLKQAVLDKRIKDLLTENLSQNLLDTI